MRESGEALVAAPRDHQGPEGAGPRLRRRHDGDAGGEAGRRRAGRRHRAQPGRGRQPARQAGGPHELQVPAGRRDQPGGLADGSFDLVVSIFGAMFAPKPFDVAKEMVRVTRPGGRIVMGNWIPNDPTLVAQILKISSAYSPPPPEGFVSPMTWGVESNVRRALRRARACPKEQDLVRRATRTPSTFPGPQPSSSPPSASYYGPTMNAFEAAEKNGRADELATGAGGAVHGQNKSAEPARRRSPRPSCA